MTGRQEFMLRRLHSLLGVIPVGIFLMVHLTVNYFATKGVESYNAAASFMGNLPYQIWLELFIIFVPLAYHAIYGLYMAYTAKNNVGQYGYFRNWMFFVQRITGIITLVFVVWHVWQTRLQLALFGTEVNFQMMADILASPVALWLYVIGVLSAVFHFANGIWGFCVTWGITVNKKSQKIVTYVSMGLFLVLAAIALRAIFSFI